MNWGVLARVLARLRAGSRPDRWKWTRLLVLAGARFTPSNGILMQQAGEAMHHLRGPLRDDRWLMVPAGCGRVAMLVVGEHRRHLMLARCNPSDGCLVLERMAQLPQLLVDAPAIEQQLHADGVRRGSESCHFADPCWRHCTEQGAAGKDQSPALCVSPRGRSGNIPSSGPTVEFTRITSLRP